MRPEASSLLCLPPGLRDALQDVLPLRPAASAVHGDPLCPAYRLPPGPLCPGTDLRPAELCLPRKLVTTRAEDWLPRPSTSFLNLILAQTGAAMTVAPVFLLKGNRGGGKYGIRVCT